MVKVLHTSSSVKREVVESGAVMPRTRSDMVVHELKANQIG